MVRQALLAVPAALLLAGCHLVLDLDDIQAQDAGTIDGGRRPDSSHADPDGGEHWDGGEPEDAGDAGDGGPSCVPRTPGEVSCADFIDDDCDGLIDCAEDDCSGSSCGVGCTCSGLKRTEDLCLDGEDNDSDGKFDCQDADCRCPGPVRIDIEFDGTATGEVYIGNSRCGEPGCTVPFASADATMLVVGSPGLRSGLAWTGCDRSDGVNCHALPGARIKARFGLLNYMFVTDRALAPDTLASATAADQFCADEARRAGLDASNWIAWVSSSTESAAQRLDATQKRGWVRVDGKPFADTVFDITQNRVLYPPRINERGTAVTGVVYTATNYDGSYVGSGELPCTNASSVVVGHAEAGPGAWTNAWSVACSAAARLYCFEVDHATPLVYRPVSGRTAFVAEGFQPETGRGGADSLCRTTAAAANLPGTYLALIATRFESAASRFADAGTTPWVRLDGLPVFANHDALRNGNVEVPLSLGVGASGAPVVITNMPVFTGAATPGSLGTAETTCSDWSLGTGTATIGKACFASSAFFSGGDAQCRYDISRPDLYRVYCLQIP